MKNIVDIAERKMNPKFFPTILIILDVAASIVYWSICDIRRAVYWFAAAVLTYTVTY